MGINVDRGGIFPWTIVHKGSNKCYALHPSGRTGRLHEGENAHQKAVEDAEFALEMESCPVLLELDDLELEME